MKREAFDHPKIKLLARDLGLPMAYARGVLESLWGVAGISFPRGDVGRMSNEEMCVAIDYPGDADWLVEALLKRRLLDPLPPEEGRLYIHDWHEHCDRHTNLRVLRMKTTYADGSPARTRSDASEREATRSDASEHERTARNAKSPQPVPAPVRVPEPEPVPAPARAPVSVRAVCDKPKPAKEEVAAVLRVLADYIPEAKRDAKAAKRLLTDCRAQGKVTAEEICGEARRMLSTADLRRIENPIGWLLTTLPTHFEPDLNEARAMSAGLGGGQ